MGMLVAAYVAIRLWHLTDSCLWFDEIFSVHAAEHSWNEILPFVALDLIHPPLFYVLLKLWIGVGGESLFWLRLFPVIFAVIAIFPFNSICRELKLDFWTRVLALFFLAINGSLIKYAQEVRMYSLLLCLSLFSIWLFVRYFNKGNSFVPLLLINFLLVYTHYFGWLVIVSEIAAILLFQKARWRPMLVMFVITLVSFAPWIAEIIQASQTGSGLDQNIGWMTRPGILPLIQFKLSLIEPFYYAASSVEPMSIYRVSIPLLLIFMIGVVLYFGRWRLRSENEKQVAYLLFIFVIVPIGVAFTASWLLPYSIWGTRHLSVVFAPVVILLAGVIMKISNTTVRTAALTLIFLFSCYAFVIQANRKEPQYIWCAWEKLANELILVPHYSPERKRLFVFEDIVAYHFWYELRDFDNYDVNVVRGVDGIVEDPAYFLPRGFDRVQSIDINQITGRELWVAFREPKQEPEPPGEPFFHKSLGKPVAALGKLGFEVEEIHKIEVGGELAYLVRMLKNPRFDQQQ